MNNFVFCKIWDFNKYLKYINNSDICTLLIEIKWSNGNWINLWSIVNTCMNQQLQFNSET